MAAIDSAGFSDTDSSPFENVPLKKPNTVKRPPNAFFLYRKHLCSLIENSNGSQISKEAAVRWATETEEVKSHFVKLAESLRRDHFKLHPEYTWFKAKPKKNCLKFSKIKMTTPDDDINAAALALASIMAKEFHRNPHKNIALNILPTSFAEEKEIKKPNVSVMSMSNLIF